MTAIAARNDPRRRECRETGQFERQAMKKTVAQDDKTMASLPGDIPDNTCTPGGYSSPTGAPAWTKRMKRRWKSMLEWLAKGAEHACPT
jgi:hypothetical protein